MAVQRKGAVDGINEEVDLNIWFGTSKGDYDEREDLDERL